jgi:hypothetical protein
LLPNLYKFLDGARAGNAIVHHSTTGVSSVVGLQGSASTEARKAAPQLFEIIWTHDFIAAGLTGIPMFVMKVIPREIRTTGHDNVIVSRFALYSP